MFVHSRNGSAGKYERKTGHYNSVPDRAHGNPLYHDKPKKVILDIVAKILTWAGIGYYAYIWLLNIRNWYGDLMLGIAIAVGVVKLFSIGWRVFHKRRMDNLEYRLKKKEVEDEIFPHQ